MVMQRNYHPESIRMYLQRLVGTISPMGAEANIATTREIAAGIGD
jgi:predicted lipase